MLTTSSLRESSKGIRQSQQGRSRHSHGVLSLRSFSVPLLIAFSLLISCPNKKFGTFVEANNGYDDDGYNDDGYNDDGYNDDGYNDDNNRNGDDYYNNGDDANDDYNDNYGGYGYDDYNDYNVANDDESQYKNADDDNFHWSDNIGFDGVSVMPISCINYNNGHMIKFQLFDSENSYQCHFSEIATFIVSIAHYMRAYFNHQALLHGQDFSLPDDAGYLNCVMLEATENYDEPLYAKIGCMERETFTSTKLQLHLYTDAQCSQPYDDGQTSRKHATRGYNINDEVFQTKVSFRPPFYSCDSCTPDSISGTFNKQNGNWYDDEYISENGKKNQGQDEEQNRNNDDDNQDDAYLAANDDIYRDDDGGGGDDYYNANGDDGYYNDDGRRFLGISYTKQSNSVSFAPNTLSEYKKNFWREAKRMLYENNYDVGEWNMCQRIYRYGVWCDEDCRALDFFRTDQWSASDIFLLTIMCTFVTAMMLLVVAKRLKAQQKARIYREEQSIPGLPPLGMAFIFVFIMTVVIVLAKLRFVNETLVFAVVTCILLFIYMLKLTLFETRRPVLLAAPRHHEMFDGPLDDRMFD